MTILLEQQSIEFVTAWESWDYLDDDFHHNHLEPGHVTTAFPANPGKLPAWSSGRWRAVHCVMVPSTRYPGSKRVMPWFPGDELHPETFDVSSSA